MSRFNAVLLFLFMLIFITACGSAANKATPTPTEPPATNTPIPTPTATPTPEPVFSYYTNADDINAMALDTEGDLWAATSGGVVEWDLFSKEYTLFTRGDGLPGHDIRKIAVTSDGSIWALVNTNIFDIYSTDQLLRYQDNEWIPYGVEDGLINDHPSTLYPTENGMWIGFNGWVEREGYEDKPGGVTFYDLESDTFTSYTSENGLLGTSFSIFYVEPEGRVWAGSTTGVNWLEDGEWQSKEIGAKYYDLSELFNGLVDGLSSEILSITQAPDGSMWFGTTTGGARYANGTWSYFTKREGIYLEKELWDIEFDARGVAWGVHHGPGVYRYEYSRWWWLDQANGLPDIHYLHFIEPDPSGGLWFGTREYGALYMDYPDWIWVQEEDGGLASDEITAILPLEDGSTLFAHPGAGVSRLYLEDANLVTYQINSGVPISGISEILATSDGTLWIDAGGLYAFDGQQWENYESRNIPILGKALSSLYSLAMAPDDVLWVGLYSRATGDYRNENLVAAWDGESWTPYTVEDGLFNGNTIALDFALDGTLWALIDSQYFGSELTGVAWMQDEQWTSITSEDGFPSEEPHDLAVDGDGIVWVSTGDMGLLRYDGTEWQSLTSEDGLPGDTFSKLFVDADGNLWVAGDQALGFHDSTGWTTLTEEDGLASRYVYAFAQDEEGVMWFGTSAGATRYDGETWKTLTVEDGLPSKSVHAIACTNDGAVWFASGISGLTRYGPPQ